VSGPLKVRSIREGRLLSDDSPTSVRPVMRPSRYLGSQFVERAISAQVTLNRPPPVAVPSGVVT
jgi:hypothetical protein